VIESYADRATEDIFNGVNSVKARQRLPRNLWQIAFRKLDQLDSATVLEDLRVPPGNRLEILKGERAGQYSIRINEQYRICFGWSESNAQDVEIIDYH